SSLAALPTSACRFSGGSAMDAERLEQQVASVQRGIVFLKQEHLAMLTGLQLEITHLKRRCHGEFDEMCLCSKTLQLFLRAGQARASALGRSLREEERRFLDELKRRSHKITLLSRELQRQNVTTSTLCQELHMARLKLFQQRQSTEAAAEREEEPTEKEEEEEQEDEDDEDDEGEGSEWLLSPPPPASPSQPESRHRRRVSVREERVRACIPQERVTSPQRPHPMPDPALFLVPLRYRLLRLSQPIRTQDGEELEDEWEDIEDSSMHRRVDMGAGEGETAL
uniref:CCDC92/74 N-terminal domain-containing protein n=1 Tax=Mastacembelus armatus TaxID=205130 RepID=A0A7N8Y378_9TELE